MPETTTIYLGDRQFFLDRLDRVLNSQDAVVAEVSRDMIGSHLITKYEACLPDGVIFFIEDDSYLGRSLIGPPQLVERIARQAFGLDAIAASSSQ